MTGDCRIRGWLGGLCIVTLAVVGWSASGVRPVTGPRAPIPLDGPVLAMSLPEGGQASSSSVQIPMRDGVRLAGTLWLPSATGRFPVVVLRTPYGHGNFGGWAPLLATHGLAFLAVDVRGRYGSGGEWEPILHEGQDGADVIAWAAAQSWCNGKVGTQGGSYDAWVQVLAAVEGVPPLTTMILLVCPPDPFGNIPFDDGPLTVAGYLWGLQVRGRTGESAPDADYAAIVRTAPINGWDELAGVSVPWWDRWLTHWVWDDFWRARSFEDRLPTVTVPALLGTGWFDRDQPGAIRIFQALRRSASPAVRDGSKLVLGPWEHSLSYTPSWGELQFPANASRDWVQLMGDWQERHLRGDGMRAGAAVEYYLMGRNAWLEAREWPPERSRIEPLYLDAGGSLVSDLPVEGSDSYVYDPADPTPIADPQPAELWALLLGHVPLSLGTVVQRPDVRLYATPPLERPLPVAGEVGAEIWLESSAPDTDIGVQLVDIAPNGKVVGIQHGMTRARFRAGVEQAVPLVPGERVMVRVDLWSTAYEFPLGHRVGALVSSAQHPAYDAHRNHFDDLATGTARQPATQTIHRGGQHASRLLLPVLHEPRPPRRHLTRLP
ncbi:MAG: CocE/NonD family hydrolase [Thermoanaerobaculaceae bacterium]|nr:CocE/NonD family hydrolase [Thermoanaerobaculaceae bacterium]